MQSINASIRLSSGFLTALLALALLGRIAAANTLPQLETTDAHIQTVIEEWHWRNMAF